MTIKRLFLALFACCLMFALQAEEVTFRVKAPSAVAVGDQFLVEYSVNATGNNFRCNIEDSGLRVLTGPAAGTRTSYSSINGGQMSRSVSTSFTYYLMAEKEGSFTVPAATVSVDGKSYTSNTVTIKVLPADEPASGGNQQGSRNGASGTGGNGQGGRSSNTSISKEDVQLDIEFSKTKAYEGEAILATLKLYSKNHRVVEIADAKLPDFEGFMVQDIDLPQQQANLERYKGANYQTHVLKQYLLFPQRAGKIEIPSVSVTAVAQIVVTRRGGVFFFDMPMDYTQNVEVPVTSAPHTITVEPLPAGKPAAYMGGVGNFNIKAHLSTDHIKANEVLTYKLEIEGTGNVKYVREPEPVFPADFEIYDPKVDVSVKTTSKGMSGRKVIEYTVIPRYAGTFEIPAVEFGYFDPKAGQYRTATSQAFTLTVEKGADGSGAAGSNSNIADFSGTSQERIKHLGNDIRYIHPLSAGDLKQDSVPLYAASLYWLFFLIPLVAFIIIAIIYRRQLKLNADLDLKRTKKANKLAVKRLREASVALKSQDEGRFYEAVHKAMLGYVSDKLSIPVSELSHENVEQQLIGHGASADLAAQFVEILSTCEFARYAPTHSTRTMDELYVRSGKMLESLEDTLKK